MTIVAEFIGHSYIVNLFARLWLTETIKLLLFFKDEGVRPGKIMRRLICQVVAFAPARAEATHAGAELVDRLDILLLAVTEASRDVCTNTRCPYYGNKCKMSYEAHGNNSPGLARTGKE